VTTGTGLDAALPGVEAVIDATNTPTRDAEQAREFFAAVTEHLLAAEQRAGVGHHVVLSIVGWIGSRATLTTRASAGRSWPWLGGRDGSPGADMAEEVLLPGPDAQIAPTTFDAWLAGAGVSDSGPR
jgi:hypothetical protein